MKRALQTIHPTRALPQRNAAVQARIPIAFDQVVSDTHDHERHARDVVDVGITLLCDMIGPAGELPFPLPDLLNFCFEKSVIGVPTRRNLNQPH